MYDLLITEAKIIDGTGAKAYCGSVACQDGLIRLLSPGETPEAKEIIDAKGLCLAPGFIDPHSHGDLSLGEECNTLSKISQGITTHMGGLCGLSQFPISAERRAMVAEAVGLGGNTVLPVESFDTFRGYLQYVRTVKHAENIGFFMGHETLRLSAMGHDNRKPTATELRYMKEALEEALENGAMGLSTGLIYPPGAYAELEELVELGKVLAKYDAIYTTHMRNESDRVIQAMEEAIEIARQSGCRVNLSHLKICGKPYHGRAREMLELIGDARKKGLRITADQYPYTASATQLLFCIPPWHQSEGLAGTLAFIGTPEGRETIKEEMMAQNTEYDNLYGGCGGFDAVLVASCTVTKEAVGKTIGAWSRERNTDEFSAFFDLLIENKGDVGAIFFDIGEGDVAEIVADPGISICTDGGVGSVEDAVHPRAYGAFPRAIRKYVRETNTMPLEQMIRKMTSLTAQALQLDHKGVIAQGKDADLVLFHPESIADRADYLHSKELSAGIECVVVGGKIVYRGGQLTGETPGRVVLRGTGTKRGIDREADWEEEQG